VISLWEMNLYYIDRIMRLGWILNDIMVSVIHGSRPDDEIVVKATQQRLRAHLEDVVRETKELRLPMSEIAAARLLENLHISTNQEVLAAGEELKNRVVDEAQSIQFLHVRSEKLIHFERNHPFGPKVAEKFPGAEYDISEASNCFALGRHTATVMHCMRVLEVGLEALRVAVKAKKTHRGWGMDLKEITDAWNAKITAKPAPKNLGWRRTFFPQAFAEFRNFEFAWRNNAMHKHYNYGESESEKVFNHVRDFMQLIATRLRERRKR